MRVAFVLWAAQLDQVRARSALSLPQGLYSEYSYTIGKGGQRMDKSRVRLKHSIIMGTQAQGHIRERTPYRTAIAGRTWLLWLL